MVKTIMAKGGSELWGRLEDESLLELIEPVCVSKLTAALIIRLGHETGNFYFKDGRLVHADTKSIRGKESAYELISWRNGVFRLIRNRQPEVETVDISWDDFLQHYQEELGKIVLGRAPRVEGGLYIDMYNARREQVFFSNQLRGLRGRIPDPQWFADPDLENAIQQMHKGNLEEYRKLYRDPDNNAYAILVRYMRELRYTVYTVFPDNPIVDEQIRWLARMFEPRALDAVGLALKRADKTDVRGTVLVIDDSPTVLEMLSDILTQNGFRAFTALDGYEGLVKVGDIRPDMIFLDVMMPRMDGYEVCRRLKNDDRTRNIPVILLSQQELAQDAGEGFKEGADLYIAKPFTERKIITIVENVLGFD